MKNLIMFIYPNYLQLCEVVVFHYNLFYLSSSDITNLPSLPRKHLICRVFKFKTSWKQDQGCTDALKSWFSKLYFCLLSFLSHTVHAMIMKDQKRAALPRGWFRLLYVCVNCFCPWNVTFILLWTWLSHNSHMLPAYEKTGCIHLFPIQCTLYWLTLPRSNYIF